jgi:hypothetical protein
MGPSIEPEEEKPEAGRKNVQKRSDGTLHNEANRLFGDSLDSTIPALLETDASYLSAQDLRNAGARHRNENNTDAPRLAADKSWETQRDRRLAFEQQLSG